MIKNDRGSYNDQQMMVMPKKVLHRKSGTEKNNWELLSSLRKNNCKTSPSPFITTRDWERDEEVTIWTSSPRNQMIVEHTCKWLMVSSLFIHKIRSFFICVFVWVVIVVRGNQYTWPNIGPLQSSTNRHKWWVILAGRHLVLIWPVITNCARGSITYDDS